MFSKIDKKGVQTMVVAGLILAVLSPLVVPFVSGLIAKVLPVKAAA